MKRRGRLEIIVDILETMSSVKTRMMYTANLSFDQMNDYLRFLTEKKLCRLDNSDRTFYRTEAWNEFLWKVKDTLTYCLQVLGEGSDHEHRKDKTDSFDILEIAAIAEKGFEHPLAKAIVNHTQNSGINLNDKDPEDFESTPGRGVSARYEDMT